MRTLLFLLSSIAFAQDFAITNATIVDGTGAPPRKGTVIVHNDRISQVLPAGSRLPANTRTIDATGKTLLPGLFDLHTHLPYSAASAESVDWGKNLKAYLYCGVTTVNDFGSYVEMFSPMRQLLASGEIPGPRINFAVRLSTPGGHGMEGGRGDFFTLEALTPRQGRAAVRKALPYKPDVIKVFTDGWRYGTAPDMTSMEEATLAAIVDEAHKNNLKVLTHTVTLDKAKIAARAGVDVLAHGVGDLPVDAELIAIMKKSGTRYAPTMAVYEPRARDILTPLLETVLGKPALALMPNPLTPSTGAKPTFPAARQKRWDVLRTNTKLLFDAGIPVGLGTDAGVSGTYHGWGTLRELELMVAAGLTPLQALTVGTGNSAAALGLTDRGTIAPGKLADLILIDGAPYTNIHDIENISKVFLNGKEIDRTKLAAEIADPAQTPMSTVEATANLDDFEREDGRSNIDTLVVNTTDSGLDHAEMLFTRILREPGNHALSMLASMSEKDAPAARIDLPLSKGGVRPVDARKFQGVEFEVRGEGPYRFAIQTRAIRSTDHFATPFNATPAWTKIRIPFTQLKQRTGKVTWTGDDLFMLRWELARPAGQKGWLELDNVRFY